MENKTIGAIGFDEYTDAVYQIEKINEQINKENRSLTKDEAKKIITLLIRLLEFENVKVEIQKSDSNTYWAKTKNNEYNCFLTDDLPSDFEITSIDGKRKINSSYLINKSFKHQLSIDLDKEWYITLIDNWLRQF